MTCATKGGRGKEEGTEEEMRRKRKKEEGKLRAGIKRSIFQILECPHFRFINFTLK